MNIEEQKLAIIAEITSIQDSVLLEKIQFMLDVNKESSFPKRKAGFGKGVFSYISDDFDDFIPEGFQEYLPTNEQLVNLQKK